MKELSVYYCPGCGRYNYSRPLAHMTCPVCELPLKRLTSYSGFCRLNEEERDKLLVEKIIAGNPAACSRFLAYIRSCSSGEAAALQTPDPRCLESENQKLNETIQWMHQTIWDLLLKNKELEHTLEKSPTKAGRTGKR
ncbi:MAG: hypothetical protein HFG58_14345 [Lachnospiraceae bacterium]|jgi:hypothetical protein|nr:hypothetical protein [Lachnospiraceae bacterium]